MKTLVVGVKPGADRYANMAVDRLVKAGHEVVALGMKEGTHNGVNVQTGTPELDGIDTISLYLNPTRQAPMIDYLLSLSPRRIIFNPGTENGAFRERAEAGGIETVEGCTLVLLATGQF